MITNMMPLRILRDPYQGRDWAMVYATRMFGHQMVPSSVGIITMEQTDEYERRDRLKAAIRKALHRLPKRLRRRLKP